MPMLIKTMQATERTVILAALVGTKIMLRGLLALEKASRRR
jgi:hypothetical protein